MSNAPNPAAAATFLADTLLGLIKQPQSGSHQLNAPNARDQLAQALADMERRITQLEHELASRRG